MKREESVWWKSTLLALSVGATLNGALWLSLESPKSKEEQTLRAPDAISWSHHRVHRVRARTRAS